MSFNVMSRSGPQPRAYCAQRKSDPSFIDEGTLQTFITKLSARITPPGMGSVAALPLAQKAHICPTEVRHAPLSGQVEHRGVEPHTARPKFQSILSISPGE